MTDTPNTKVDAFIVRDFHDDGTKQRFKGGSIEPISEGAFVNYEAADLVRKPTADDRAAAKAAANADTKADAKKA